jgi:hypothetical protein
MMRKWEWIASKIYEIEKAYIRYQFANVKRLTEEQIETREKSRKIRDQCVKLKSVARRFDDFLNENYEQKTTEQWREDYDDIIDKHISDSFAAFNMLGRIRHIAGQCRYCVACDQRIGIKRAVERCGINIHCCKFGEQFGNTDCAGDESVFQREWVIGIIELEKLMRDF